jgi:pimeloyl-ACP methyl ester carboxylesterase
MPRPILYLHGFASSARSSKAAFFADRFAAHGTPIVIPDFNQPDFEHLTITRMLDQVRDALAALPAGPVAVIGSSLGAYVAVHAAAAQEAWQLDARIDRLVLLAPALDFGRVRFADLGEAALASWKESGRLDVFHHAFGRTMPLRYGLHEDAGRYDAGAVQLDLPVLIFQGRRDTVVDPQVPVRWSVGRPTVRITFLDDDHQLLSSLETIWAETSRFLQIDHNSADTLPS